MLRSIRSRLSYANVVATLALFVAMGGASYAAVTLPRNSVGSPQIRKNAVTGAKVKNKSLSAADFRGSVKGPAGPVGSKGDTGAKGDAGATGPPGPVNGDLPSGTTLRGIYAIRLDNATTPSGWVPISFGLRLPSDPAVHIVPAGGPKPLQCAGTIYMPEAAPGNLCIYRGFENGMAAPVAYRMAEAAFPDDVGGQAEVAGRVGAYLDFGLVGASAHLARGSWAVTAP